MAKLIVGLGNPGVEYDLTRHNIGWLAIDQVSFYEKLIWKEKFKGLYAQITINDEKVYFLKPHTYMNLSGESVKSLCSFFKVGLDEILVVQDEIDLDFGLVAFKNGGGLAGHNGLKSIAQHMGGQNFKRLRIGIGRPKHGSVADFVLKRFTSEEDIVLEKLLPLCAQAIEEFINKGFESAARTFSKKKVI